MNFLIEDMNAELIMIFVFMYFKGNNAVRSFSLLELVLALSLSSIIVVAIMTLIASFSHIYLSSSTSDIEKINKICYEKFIQLSLNEYVHSGVFNEEVDESLLKGGIFWQTKNVYAFVDNITSEKFIVGLVYCDNCFQFLWKPAGKDEFTNSEFYTFNLFNHVKSVHLLRYDLERDIWTKEEFDHETVRYFLHKEDICYLVVKTADDNFYFQLF